MVDATMGNVSIADDTVTVDVKTRTKEAVSVVAALSLISLLVNSYVFGRAEQVEQILLIRRVLDRSFLQHDWFVNSNNGLNVRSLFSLLMAGFAYVFGIEGSYLIVYLCFLVLLCLATYLLANAIWREPAVGLIAIPIVLYNEAGSPGRNQLLSSFLFTACIAYSMVALGAYLLYVRRYLASILLFGLIGLLHPLTGPEAVLIFGAAAVLSWNRGERGTLLKYLPLLILMAAIPVGMGLFIKQGADVHVNQAEAMDILTRMRAPHHYIPWMWSTATWVLFAGFVLLLVIARLRVPASAFLDWLSLAIVGFWIVGLIGFFVEALVNTVILQPFRMAVFLQWAAALYFARYVWLLLNEKAWASRVAGIVLGIGLVVQKQMPDAFIVWLALMMLLFELIRVGVQRIKPMAPLSWVQVVPLLVVVMYLLVHIPSQVVNPLQLQHLLITVGSVGAAAFCGWALYRGRYRVPIMRVSIGVSLYVLLGLGAAWLGIRLPQPFAQINRQLLPHMRYSGYFDLTATWARKNTPPDALFIVPPYLSGFRLKAERAIVIDFALSTIKDTSMLDWYARITDFAGGRKLSLGYDAEPQLQAAYGSLTQKQFVALARKYGAQYIVVEHDKPLALPVAYENKMFITYAVPK